MSEDKKENNGITTFLVVLSALGMLAIIIAVAFAFFYPGGWNPQDSSVDQPNLASLMDDDPRDGLSIEDPSAGDPSETASAEEPNDDMPEEGVSDDLPHPIAELDDTEALINSLMSEEGEDSQGQLTIQFPDEDDDQDHDAVQEAEPVEEPTRQPVVAVTPREPQPVYQDVSRDVYWIQVASFPNSVKADDLQQLLQGKGISSTIQTRNVNGTLYYRVRIGAFNARSEADNFNQQILALPEIDETTIYTSQVTERVRVR